MYVKIIKSADGLEGVRFEAPARVIKAYEEITNSGEENETKVRKIDMLASGVKIDTYGDRMSMNALKDMATGMIEKDFLPDHWADWSDVLGTIVGGKVVKDEYFATAQLDPVTEAGRDKADALFSLVKSGKKVGVSIAGRIKRVFFEEGDHEDMIRVIDSIEPDHIAATRRPAYGDASTTGVAKTALDMGEGMLPYLLKSLNDNGIDSHALKMLDEDETPSAMIEKIDSSDSETETTDLPVDLPEEVLPQKDDANLVEAEHTPSEMFDVSHSQADETLEGEEEMEFEEPEANVIEIAEDTEVEVEGEPELEVADQGVERETPDPITVAQVFAQYITYRTEHEVNENQAAQDIALILSGDSPACLEEEEFEMDASELAEVLKQQSEAQSVAQAEALKSAMTPVADSLKVVSDGMAAILAATSKANEKAQETADAAQETIDKVADAPDRIGVSTASDAVREGIEEEIEEVDAVQSILREAMTREFQEHSKAKPGQALREFLAAFEDSTGYNHILDVMREQGVESPQVASAHGQVQWARNISQG